MNKLKKWIHGSVDWVLLAIPLVTAVLVISCPQLAWVSIVAAAASAVWKARDLLQRKRKRTSPVRLTIKVVNRAKNTRLRMRIRMRRKPAK